MYLGIDVGTSAVKLSLVGDDLKQIGAAEAPLSASKPHPYWSEQDPEAWQAALAKAAAALGAKHDLKAVRAVGLSGQMHGAVLLDADCAVIRPAILWNDGRSHAECDLLTERVPEIGQIAGVPPMPGFTAPKLLWLERHEPAAHARVAHILLPKDYIGWLLTGAFATDRSDAAGSHWLDQAARAWSPLLAAASATSLDWLPPLHDGVDVIGAVTPEAAAALGLPPGVPVAAEGGDAATGAVGVGAVVDGAAFLSLGTSGQLFVATDRFRPNPAEMVHAYCHTVPGLWFQMAAMLNGARPLQWFADVSGVSVATLLAEAEDADLDATPLFLPYLTGERSPHGDAHIRGAFYGLADGAGRPEMARGVVDAIAFSFADAAKSMRGADLSDILAIGGGAQSDLLLQTIANVLGVAISRSADPTTGPALGAAKLAAVAVGGATLGDLAGRPTVETVFEPQSEVRLQAGLAGYRALYRRLKGIHLEIAGQSA